MRRALVVLLSTVVVAACGGAGTSTGGSSASAPTPPSSASALPSTAPSTSADPVLAGAVADALATIDEIDRLYTAATGDASFALIGEVATSGRASLAREPARITTMQVFHSYDLSLQLFEVNVILKDGPQMVKDHAWLLSPYVREKIAALVH